MAKKKESPEDRANALMTGILRKYMISCGVDSQELAAALRMCRDTLFRRLKRPGELTIDELRIACRKLDIPVEEILPVIALGRRNPR